MLKNNNDEKLKRVQLDKKKDFLDDLFFLGFNQIRHRFPIPKFGLLLGIQIIGCV